MSTRSHPAFEGVLVDLFGTLVPASPRASRTPHLHRMAAILHADAAKFERDWAESFEDRVTGRLGPLEETIRRIAARQGLEPSPSAVRNALETRLAFTRSVLESCGPVLPGLDALRTAGVHLAVVSDASEEPSRLWSSTALGDRIEATVFSCLQGYCKPDPRMYLTALEKLGLPASRCAFVGDGGSRELTGAKAVGLATFLYRFPGDPPDLDGRYDPDTEWRGTTLKDLRELLAVSR
jgi:putative hydrolase of the HAD superfamily